MKIGKVVGRAVMCHVNPDLKGHKFLIIKPVDYKLRPKGETYISIDSVGAGFGEFVFIITSAESGIPFKPAKTPADHCIVGIIDELTLLRKDNEKIIFYEHLKKVNPDFEKALKKMKAQKRKK